jgi:DNA-binding SARP family transcriptional activator
MSRLCITLLGAFRVTLDGEHQTSFGTDKARALLAYLAVEGHRPHRREHLAGLLWSDQAEKKALDSLRQSLSSLRKLLQDQDLDSSVQP